MLLLDVLLLDVPAPDELLPDVLAPDELLPDVLPLLELEAEAEPPVPGEVLRVPHAPARPSAIRADSDHVQRMRSMRTALARWASCV